MIKQFRDLLLDNIKIKFPMKKNEYGFYDAIYSEHEHDLRCPNCGGTVWAIKNYQRVECITCYKNYSNLGVLGLQEL
jgi:protein-arginine kinase activator protein McsA